MAKPGRGDGQDTDGVGVGREESHRQEKKGSKRSLLVDERGVPLSLVLEHPRCQAPRPHPGRHYRRMSQRKSAPRRTFQPTIFSMNFNAPNRATSGFMQIFTGILSKTTFIRPLLRKFFMNSPLVNIDRILPAMPPAR
jgi:hypothetical protein